MTATGRRKRRAAGPPGAVGAGGPVPLPWPRRPALPRPRVQAGFPAVSRAAAADYRAVRARSRRLAEEAAPPR